MPTKYWEEPESLRKIREITDRINKISGLADLHKTISAIETALKASEIYGSLENIKILTQNMQLVWPTIEAQQHYKNVSMNHTMIQSAIKASEAFSSVADAYPSVYELQNNYQQLLGNHKLFSALQESTAWRNNYEKVFRSFGTISSIIESINVSSFVGTLIEKEPSVVDLITEYVKKFDFDSLELEDDVLTYDGHAYSIDELQQEFATEIENIEKKQSLRGLFL